MNHADIWNALHAHATKEHERADKDESESNRDAAGAAVKAVLLGPVGSPSI